MGHSVVFSQSSPFPLTQVDLKISLPSWSVFPNNLLDSFQVIHYVRWWNPLSKTLGPIPAAHSAPCDSNKAPRNNNNEIDKNKGNPIKIEKTTRIFHCCKITETYHF